MDRYDPATVESKWAKKWEELSGYRAQDYSKKEKKYYLVEFPYPSGSGLHVGHTWGYTMGDVMARYSRMQGKNVMFPMGWDAFGLPAENYAVKTGIHPRKTTEENIANFKNQMRHMGFSFDWTREIDTTDPTYYKWTQWIFLQFYNNKLAYKKEMPINWCPFCKTGLAHEEVTSENRHERCGHKVTKKMVSQWLLKITAYADRLIDDLSMVDYSDDIKQQQINWIGRKEGARIGFEVEGADHKIEVFTTRPDTLPGVTFIVLAPENPLVKTLTSPENRASVETYINQAMQKSELERTELQKEKTGAFIGAYAVNPLNGDRIPIWVADYVLWGYGTGAVMGVPAHDERDMTFAERYELEVIPVIKPSQAQQKTDNSNTNTTTSVYEDKMGELINAGEWNGWQMPEDFEKVLGWLEEKSVGKREVAYKLRDWIFSRQHYWGEPIPIIYCHKCGEVPVPEEDLPVELPNINSFEPTDDGCSPLAKAKDWINVKCPKCGGDAQRESDTMPNWAGSSWYYLRYCDPQNKEVFADNKLIDYYLPVDLYIGGAEHTTLHLLYSRFWHKFLFDIGQVSMTEPYRKRRNRGLILGVDGRKMSKSFGNIINPDDEVKKVGADTLRMYELFIGPFQGTFPWDPKSEKGLYRFLEKIWQTSQGIAKAENIQTSDNIEFKLHCTIKKVQNDIEELKFNTAIAAMMEFVNDVTSLSQGISKSDWEKFIIILAPFAPFIAEEIWQTYLSSQNGDFVSVHSQDWPVYDEGKTIADYVTIPIQVNGRLRATLRVEKEKSSDKEFIVGEIEQQKLLDKYINPEMPLLETKNIFVPGRLINFVFSTARDESFN